MPRPGITSATKTIRPDKKTFGGQDRATIFAPVTSGSHGLFSRIRAGQIPNLPKFLQICSSTTRLIYMGERRPPAKPGPPSLEVSQKSMLFPGHERREKPACATRFTALVVRYSGECEPQRDSLQKSADEFPRPDSVKVHYALQGHAKSQRPSPNHAAERRP